MAELKPCPFCGGKKIGYSIKTATSNYQRIYHAAMYCGKCHSYGGRVLIHPVENTPAPTAERRMIVKDKRTVFIGVFQYKDKEFTIHYDFGVGYPDKSAKFMFFDGNYSCDCNRSLFIRWEYGDNSIPELCCGDEIVLKEYHIEHLTEKELHYLTSH